MPLDPCSSICFGDDPDEIVTIVEQPCKCESQGLPASAITRVLPCGVLPAPAAMTDAAPPPGSTAGFAQAT